MERDKIDMWLDVQIEGQVDRHGLKKRLDFLVFFRDVWL